MQCAVKLDVKGNLEKVRNTEDLPTLDFIYRNVECSFYEEVHACGLKEGYFLAVNEEGLFAEKPFINPIASWLYGFHEHGQPIVGNALIMKIVYTEDGPDTGFLEEHEADLLISWLLERRPIMIRDMRSALVNYGLDFIVEKS